MKPLGGCNYRNSRYGTANIPVSSIVVQVRQCKQAELRGNLSPSYGACSKAMFTLKGSYGCGEPKNVTFRWVQLPYLPLRDSKHPGFIHRRIGPTKDAELRGNLSPWYGVCTKAMFTLKGSYGCREPKNVPFGWEQTPYLPLRDSKHPGFIHRRIGPTM